VNGSILAVGCWALALGLFCAAGEARGDVARLTLAGVQAALPPPTSAMPPGLRLLDRDLDPGPLVLELELASLGLLSLEPDLLPGEKLAMSEVVGPLALPPIVFDRTDLIINYVLAVPVLSF